MYHPAALHGAMRTAACVRKYLEMDDRLAAWEPKLGDMLSSTRDAIARSRHLLAELDGRDAMSSRPPAELDEAAKLAA